MGESNDGGLILCRVEFEHKSYYLVSSSQVSNAEHGTQIELELEIGIVSAQLNSIIILSTSKVIRTANVHEVPLSEMDI